jgi:hypothetical protein
VSRKFIISSFNTLKSSVKYVLPVLTIILPTGHIVRFCMIFTVNSEDFPKEKQH